MFTTTEMDYIKRDTRRVLLETELGTYIYNDGDKEYKRLKSPQSRTISNIDSFTKVVLEEARRLNNPTGDFMTVIFTEKGAKFYTDDKLRGDTWAYERSLSQQWSWLLDSINKPMTHLELLRRIQGLKPSITDYRNLFNQFKRVSITNNTVVTSQPILEDGRTNAELVFNMEAKAGSGETQAHMPGELLLTMPYTKGFDKQYEFTIELDGHTDEQSKIRFRLVFPERELVEEAAIADELTYFQEKTSALPNLLTVLSL